MVFLDDQKRKMAWECLLNYLYRLDQLFKNFERAKKIMKDKNILK